MKPRRKARTLVWYGLFDGRKLVCVRERESSARYEGNSCGYLSAKVRPVTITERTRKRRKGK